MEKAQAVSESVSQVPVRAEEMKQSLRPGKGEPEQEKGTAVRFSCKCEVQVEHEKVKRGRKPNGTKGREEKAAVGRKASAGGRSAKNRKLNCGRLQEKLKETHSYQEAKPPVRYEH